MEFFEGDNGAFLGNSFAMFCYYYIHFAMFNDSLGFVSKEHKMNNNPNTNCLWRATRRAPPPP